MTKFKPLTPTERAEINVIRLERHWSYRELAAQVRLPITTVQSALKYANKRPVATTVYRLRQWLESNRAERAAQTDAARGALARLDEQGRAS